MVSNWNMFIISKKKMWIKLKNNLSLSKYNSANYKTDIQIHDWVYILIIRSKHTLILMFLSIGIYNIDVRTKNTEIWN